MKLSLASGLGRARPPSAILRAILLCCPVLAQGANATWTASSNGAWDTASNWSTGAAASGSTSTATFGAATGTGISINTAVTIGTLQFNSGAPAYSLAVNSNASLTLGASGIVNNSSNPFSLTVNANARVNFNGTSSAGNSILFLNSQGVIDFSNSTGTITAGSIAGSTSTNIYLGSRLLTVGSLNSSTLFQGIISDGGNSGATGGRLTKVGTGTLTLDRDNTYTGGTTISAGALQVGNNGSTGSILGNVTNNSSLIFRRSGTYTFAGTISGTGSVTNSGSGTVTLSGTNTYSGGTLLNAGSLRASSNANLGNISGGLTFNGGTLLYGAGFTSARNVTLTGNGTFNTNTFSSTLSGTISGAGNLTKSSTGTLTLTGTNSYTGSTTVSGGTLQLGAGGTTGTIAGNVSVSSGAALAFSRSDSQTFGSVISGSGSLSKLGTNTLTLSGANTYSGGTTVNGTLIVTGANTGGGTATVNSGGLLQIGSGGTTGSLASAVANSGTLTFNRSDSLTYAGAISGAGDMTKLGSGTLTLTGANSYTGNTTISAGTLQIGNGSSGALVGNVANSGSLVFGRTGTLTYGGSISGSGSITNLGAGTVVFTGANTYSGGTTISAGTLQIGNGGTTGSLAGAIVNNSVLAFNRLDDLSFAGLISGSGSLLKQNTNTLTLAGNNTYSGSTTVSDGILLLTGANTGTGAISIGSTAGLQVGSGGTSGSIAGNVANGGTITFDRSDNSTYGGVISGVGTLTKQGAGILTLTGASTYTGVTTISAGTLQIGNGGTTGSLLGDIVNNSVLAFNRSDDFSFDGDITGTGSLVKDGAGTLTLMGTINYAGTTTILAGNLLIGTGGNTGGLVGDLIINTALTFNRADDYLYGGVISGTGSFTKLGAGTLTFTGENLYTGGTTISQGALQLGNGGTTGSIVGNVVDNSSLIFNHSNDIVFAGAISGSGTVTKLGAGALTLTGASSVTGTTTIGAGTLQIGDGGTSGSLAASSIVNNSALVFNRSDDLSFAGLISGAGSLTKQNTNTLTLTANNTYSGSTTVNGGTLLLTGANTGAGAIAVGATAGLRIGNGGTSGSIIGNVENGGTITFDRSDNSTYGGEISGNGSLTKLGAGTLTLTGANTYSGGTTISAGTLEIGNGGTIGSIVGNVTNYGVLAFDRSDDQAFGGVISGSGSVTKLGSNTLTLTGNTAYSGGTSVNAGTLILTGTNAGSGVMTVAPSAALQIGNGGTSGLLLASITNNGAVTFNRSSNSTYSGAISGAGTLTKAGAGTLTLTGNSSYTGGTTISAGTLQIGNGGTTGGLAGDIVNNGALAFNRSDDLTFAGAISGSGGLTKLGAGTLVLTANHSFTGTTTISAGTLQVGNGGTTGFIAGNIVNDGVLAFNRSDDFTLGGNISGTGSLIKDGAGTLTLTGTINYSGTTTILGGALLVGVGGTTGTLIGDLFINTSLTFNRSDDYSYGGVISGAGSLTKIGAGTLTFTGENLYTGGTTINEGALQLGNGGTTGSIVGNVVDNSSLIFNHSNDVTFGGLISGTGSVTKLGAGILTLTNNNTYAGSTTVSAGTLLLTGVKSGGGATTIGSGGSVQIGDGGTTGSLAGAVDVGGTLVFNRSDYTVFGGPLSGSGSIVKLGSGQLTLTGTSTFNGTTTVSAGILAGTTQSLRGSIANEGTVYFDQNSAGTYTGVISGTGALSKQGHKLTLTGANTYTGATSFAGEIEVAGATASIDGTSGITLAPSASFIQATLRASAGATITTPGSLVVGETGSGWLHLTSGSSLNSGSAVLGASAGSNGTALIAGGTSGAWTNTGALVVGSAGTGSLTVENNSTLHSGAIVLGELAGSTGTLTIGLGVSAATIDAPSVTGGAGSTSLVSFHHNNPSYTFAPLLAGNLRVEQRGSGTTELSGTNTYTGGTTIRGGALSIYSDSALGDSAGILTFDGGTLMSHGATIARAVTLASGGGTLDTGNSGPTFSGVISGSGALSVTGSGYLFLTGANTYSGGTFVNNGHLVGNSTSLHGSIVNETYVQFEQTSAGTFAGSISGSGEIYKQGSKLTLTGVNTHSGATTIGGGVMEVNGGTINGTSGITLATVSFANATLDINNSLSSVRTTGSMTVGQAGTGTLTVSNGSLLTSADGTLGAVAGSHGNATVTGSSSLWSNSGVLTVGGSGTGTLTVSAGGLVSASNIRLGDVAGSSGTLNIGMGAGAGTLNTATITGGEGASSVVSFNHNDAGLTIASQLGGSLAVNQVGSGTTILTGTNTYTGLTTISGGTLQIGNGGTTGSIVGDIVNNGVLAFNRSDDFMFGGAISGTGSLIKDGAGTLTLTGSVTYTGTTTVLGGALLIGNGGNSGNWDGDLNINSSLTFNRSDNLTYSHIVSGTGSLIKIGTGTLTLTNANTYTGGTTISVGTLQIGNGGTTGSVVGNIANNANLTFNRSNDVTFGGVISGTGTLTKLGAGALTLTANNTYSGGTAVSAGTLQVGDGGTSGRIVGNVTNNGAVIFNRSDDLSYGGAISGSGSFTKLGAGALVVTGNNTYTGTTTVDGGLTVSGGGRIEGTSGITLGQGVLQSGTLHVTGAGSRVTTAGVIVVGSSGTGVLTLDNGATVNASMVRLGEAAGSIGMLNIGSGAAPGMLNAATVIDGAGANSVVNLNHTDSSYTLASNLLNTLTLNHNGAGTTTLTGTNSYTGGTYINAGTLRITSNLNLGGAASVLNFNGGTLQLGATITNMPRPIVLNSGGGTIDTGTFSMLSTGAVFGPGGLTKTGTGALTLNGTSNYTGGTTVAAGSLRGTTDSLKNDILNNGNVTFLQTASGTYSGSMSGTGTLTKSNPGNLTLSGANTFTGLTTVSSGTLTVNGSLASPVTVGENGTLAGSGTINGAVSMSGLFAPGNPATDPFGTMTVNGNLTFEAGSVFRVQTDELGQNGKIGVIGASHSATINGGTVEVMTGGGEYAPSTQYTLLSAAGGVTGAFESVSTDFAFLDPELSYDEDEVFLTLSRNDVPFSGLAQTEGQVAAASYLESLAGDDSAAPLIRSVTNLGKSDASKAFEDLSGGSLNTMSRVSMAGTARLFEMMASRLGTADDGAGTGLAFSTLSTRTPRAVTSSRARAAGADANTGFWSRQLVTGNGRAKTNGVDGEEAASQGLHTAVGFDANLDDETLVGVSAVYSRDYLDLAPGRARMSRARTPRVVAYASHTGDEVQLRGVFGCGEHSYDSRRAVTLGASTSLANASHDARECSVYAQAELGGEQRSNNLRPLVGLMYSRLAERAYVETDSSAALAVAGHTTESITSNAGLRYTHALGGDKGFFEARAVWSHELGDVKPALRATLANVGDSSGFMAQGAARSRDSAVLGAGVAAELGRGFLFHTDYNFEIGSDHRSHHVFQAGVSYRH